VVVVDSGSQDGTAETAALMGAKVVQFSYTEGGPKKKNWALSEIPFKNDWILILDADERITADLAQEIADTVGKTKTTHSGFYINRRNYFLGKWIRHAGYYPSWNLRLVRRGYAQYERLTQTDTQSGDNEVHEHMIVNGPIGTLKEPMDHFAYLSVDQFIEKHNRYSNWEAALGDRIFDPLDNQVGCTDISGTLNRKRMLKRLARKFPFPHWLRFAYHYFLKLGFLDGIEGYIFCHLLAEYEYWIWAKSVIPLRTVGAQSRVPGVETSASSLQECTRGSGDDARITLIEPAKPPQPRPQQNAHISTESSVLPRPSLDGSARQ
jgi:glycosyltransferase involved in cell wall biosynthesis